MGEASLVASGGAEIGWSTRSCAQRALKRAASVHDGLRPPARGVVVLCYHRVGARSTAFEIDLPEARFDEQMARVAEGDAAVSLDDALAALKSDALESATMPARDRVVVSFDDGTADFVDVALPILVRRKVPAVLYVATDFIERGRSFPDGGTPLSWSGIRDAVATGLVTIGSHTHTHALLDRVDRATTVSELDRSIELIGEHTGNAPQHFAYPKAVFGNADAEAAVRDRFRSAAVAGTRPNRYGHTDPYRLHRSPVQRADGIKFFERKLSGGRRLEDDLRRLVNRVRYIGATA